ncbi:MAG: 3-hydroxybutyryl-CoA dehydratase [Thermoleophilaceae bacterium]|jgi:acyl dehydratase|nr:3-hydroxybutyryl-CoA dehydratase [Thermoleophilaceae bacterium]
MPDVELPVLSRPFDELVPGDRFETRGRTLTEADVVAFSALTGDWHPQHSDREWAARSPFGRRIAHGLLVMSCAAGMVPFDPEHVVALRRVGAVFKSPVAFGDTISVRGKVERVAPIDDVVGLVECVWTVRNQDARTVLRANVEVLWRRAAAPAAVGVTGPDVAWTGGVIPC